MDRAARDPRLLAGFIFLLAAALAIRIAGAGGELWLDEIWSLHVVDQMKSGHVLAAIATDNNHYINTLYLWLVGPDASPRLIRALSILLGVAGVGTAGWLQRRRGVVAILAAMALVAISYPMVNAGSEARGYAGMLLCALISIGLTERALDARSSRAGLLLGVSNLVGVLFQPLMVGMIGSLGLWAFWITWREQRSLRAAAATARDLFAWTVRLLVPIVLVIGIAVHFGGGYVLGGSAPFTAALMLDGIAQLFRFLLGVPAAIPDVAVLTIVLAVVALAVVLDRADRRLALYVIVLVALPAAMTLVRMPNVYVPRYYLLPGLVFLLLLADLFGSLAGRGGAARIVAGAAMIAILVGNAVELHRAITLGRGAVAEMTQAIVDQGGGAVASNMPRDKPVLDYFMARNGGPVHAVASADACKEHPRWILTSDARELPEQVTLGAPDCALSFQRQATFQPWGLSGLPWTLYRAQ